MSGFTDRLRQAREDAGLTGSELAFWLGASKSTVYSWLRGHVPFHYTARAVAPRLAALERELARKTKRSFPIPLAVRQKDRLAYVRRVRASASF